MAYIPEASAIPLPKGTTVVNGRYIVPHPPDPFNWTEAVNQQRQQQNIKQRAKQKIQAAPATPRALAPSAPAAATDPFAGMTPKQQLDFYRDFNGGALPPGMTPEMAALIDSGIDIQGMASTNPAMANVMMQIQQAMANIPAEYAAGKASVNASYDQLTGDVLQSGQNWMKDLYGRVVDPNDPNYVAAQNDPALAEYAQSMANIDETSDLNRATDLAWFDKIQQNSTSMYQNMLAQLAAQAATPAAAAKGGGGGGGRGRRGGGGGGSGSGEWKIPSNKLANLQSGTETGTETETAFSPDFQKDMVAAALESGDPELAAVFQRIWETSSQDARGVTQDTAKALTAADQLATQFELQKGLHSNWTNATPGITQKAIGKLLKNKHAVLGDDPTTPQMEPYYVLPQGAIQGDNPATEKREPYYYPKGVKPPTTQEVFNFSDAEEAENALAEELLAARSGLPAREQFKKIFNPKGWAGFGAKPVRVNSPEGDVERASKGAVSPAQIKILARQGLLDYNAAKTAAGKDFPLDIQQWAGAGGFVPGVLPEEEEKNQTARDRYNWILDNALRWNPNANFVPTKRTFVNQGKNSSTYTSSTTNKSKEYGLPGSPSDLNYDIPLPALASNPLANPQGFEDYGQDELETTGAVGQGRLIRLPVGSRATLDEAAESIMGPSNVKNQAKARVRGFNVSYPRPQQQPVIPEPVVAPTRTVVRPNLSDIISGGGKQPKNIFKALGIKSGPGPSTPISAGPTSKLNPKKTASSKIRPRW